MFRGYGMIRMVNVDLPTYQTLAASEFYFSRNIRNIRNTDAVDGICAFLGVGTRRAHFDRAFEIMEHGCSLTVCVRHARAGRLARLFSPFRSCYAMEHTDAEHVLEPSRRAFHVPRVCSSGVPRYPGGWVSLKAPDTQYT